MAAEDVFTSTEDNNPVNFFDPSSLSNQLISSPSSDFLSSSRPSLKRKRSSFLHPSSNEVSQRILAMATQAPLKVAFDPAKHLAFAPPKKIHTMKEIGLENQGLSPNAVSEPFPLFTEEATNIMRSEIFSKDVLENCMYSSNLAPCQLRGFAADYAPFTYDAWTHPEVLKIVSKIAGIDLVPEMDFEIAHVNISINSEEEQAKAAMTIAEHNKRQADEGVSGCPIVEDTPVVGWHTDSYPFVCVLMLSDCTNMLGGETALRTGTGEIMKVRGPGKGNAVVMQGRYIEHQALRTIGGQERITAVTSFRPKSALIKDDTVLTTVRSISNVPQLYFGYSEYQLNRIEERIRHQLSKIRNRQYAHRKFDTADTKKFLEGIKDDVNSMLTQMVDEDKIIPGFTDHTHLRSEDLIAASKKQPTT